MNLAISTYLLIFIVLSAVVVVYLWSRNNKPVEVTQTVTPTRQVVTPIPVTTPTPVVIERPVFPEHELAERPPIMEMEEHPIRSMMVLPESLDFLRQF